MLRPMGYVLLNCVTGSKKTVHLIRAAQIDERSKELGLFIGELFQVDFHESEVRFGSSLGQGM